MTYPLDPAGPDLTTSEAMEHLRFRSERTVQRYCKRGLFPGAYRTEGQWRIPQSALIQYRERASV